MRTNKVNDPENFEVPVVSGRPEPQAPEGRHLGLQKPFCTGDKTKWRGRPILRVLPKGGGRSREAKVQRLRSKNGECRIAKEEGAYAPIFPIRHSLCRLSGAPVRRLNMDPGLTPVARHFRPSGATVLDPGGVWRASTPDRSPVGVCTASSESSELMALL